MILVARNVNDAIVAPMVECGGVAFFGSLKSGGRFLWVLLARIWLQSLGKCFDNFYLKYISLNVYCQCDLQI
jgi:hypothetical protein